VTGLLGIGLGDVSAYLSLPLWRYVLGCPLLLVFFVGAHRATWGGRTTLGAYFIPGRIFISFTLGFFALLSLVAAIVSIETALGWDVGKEVANRRRLELLVLYPPGKTNRSEVESKWAPTQPDLSEIRPAAGWGSSLNAEVRKRVAASELRTGKAVYRTDRYTGLEDLFSLCYCWFYYDEQDRVVDVEWQYHSD
jgi:hypothetical protein